MLDVICERPIFNIFVPTQVCYQGQTKILCLLAYFWYLKSASLLLFVYKCPKCTLLHPLLRLCSSFSRDFCQRFNQKKARQNHWRKVYGHDISLISPSTFSNSTITLDLYFIIFKLQIFILRTEKFFTCQNLTQFYPHIYIFSDASTSNTQAQFSFTLHKISIYARINSKAFILFLTKQKKIKEKKKSMQIKLVQITQAI